MRDEVKFPTITVADFTTRAKAIMTEMALWPSPQ
jgi:hypothetical protein